MMGVPPLPDESTDDSRDSSDPGSMATFRLALLSACEQFERIWREQGVCDPEPLLARFPAGQQALVRATLDDLEAELREETTAVPQPASGTARERFQIRRRLATGGMGTVFEAFDSEFQRLVALKEILPVGAADPGHRQRFLAEAEITARLEHPGIIPVYARGNPPDGHPFYAMRLITGERAGTLKQAVQRFHSTQGTAAAERDLDFRALLRRVIDVCQTMAYAHGQGVLHRDLKPANVLLGPHGETLVVDWGLAKDLRPSLSPRSGETPEPLRGSEDAPPQSGEAMPFARENGPGDSPLPAGGSPCGPRDVPPVLQAVHAGLSPAVAGPVPPSRPESRRAPTDPGGASGRATGEADPMAQQAGRFLPEGAGWSVRGSRASPGSSQITRGLGTPGHAAPEQLLGEPAAATPASDIYSLGTVLYEVLTGKSPFGSWTAGDPQELLPRIVAGDFPRPREISPEIDPGLEAVCLRAMAVEPGQRYPSASALAADLERYLAGEPVSVHAEPWMTRTRRWVARHRTLVTALGVGLLLTSLGATTVAVLQIRSGVMLTDKAIQLEAARSQAAHEARVARVEADRAEEERRVATAAQATAEEERGRALANETLALRAMDGFRQAVVANPELARNPQLQTLRRELLQRPLEFYRQLREQLLAVPQPSLESLGKLRDATSRLAVLQTDIGDLGEAIRLHESVLDLSDRALADPDVATPALQLRWRKTRAIAHLSIGTTLARGDNKPRELREYERALAELEPLCDTHADDPQLNVLRASALTGIASTLSALNRLGEARRRFEQAAELHRSNVARAPGEPEIRRNLARSQYNFAQLLDRLGERTAAEEIRHEAETSFQLAGDRPVSSPESRHRRAATQFNRGVRLMREGQHDQSLQAHRAAEADWRALGQEFPANNEYANVLLPVLMNIATLLDQAGRHSESLRVLDDLVQRERELIEKSPDIGDYRRQLVDALRMQGHQWLRLGGESQARAAFEEAQTGAETLLTGADPEPRWPRLWVELGRQLAGLDHDAGRFAEAQSRLESVRERAVVLATRPSAEPFDREQLRQLLDQLAEVQLALGAGEESVKTHQQRLEWDRQDPALGPLDRRLREIAGGGSPDSLAERWNLAQRAAACDEYAVGLRLCVEALDADPTLGTGRDQLWGELAAMLAVARAGELVGSAAGDPAGEATGQAQNLRQRARDWLRRELKLWGEAGATREEALRRALRRWRTSRLLATTRAPERQPGWSPAEQREWRELWQAVDELVRSPAPTSR